MTNVFATEDGNTAQDQSGTPDVNTTVEAPDTQQGSLFETLVGEGRKYSDPEALAKSRIHADEHINRIEEENARMKEELAKAKAREELVAELKQQQGVDKTPAQADTNAETITAEQIDERIRNALKETDANKRASENVEITSEAIFAQHGEKSQEFVARKAKELGVSVDFLMQTAAQSPKAALSVLGISETPVARRESSVAPSSIQAPIGNTEQSRYEQLEKMRKENKRAFYADPALSVEWHTLKNKVKQ